MDTKDYNEIYQMIKDHRFKMDSALIKEVADTIINKRGLDEFVSGVIVTDKDLSNGDLTRNSNGEVLGSYDFNNQVIYVKNDPERDYINILRVLLHELEHANQHYQSLYANDKNHIKSQLFRLALFQSESKYLLQPLFKGDIGVEYYLNSYDDILYSTHPYERYARIDSQVFLMNILKNRDLDNKEDHKLMLERLADYLNRGYYRYNGFDLNPTHLYIYFCLNSGIISEKRALKLFDLIEKQEKQLNEDDKLYLGLKTKSKYKSTYIDY